MSDPEIHTSSSADELAATVAGRLVARLIAVQAERRVPAVALTGGSIAVKIHEAVVSAHLSGDVDWSRVDFWWGDERYVPADDEERNAGQAREAMLSHLDVDPERVHEMPASDGPHDTLDEAAAAYGDELREDGTDLFDVVMLGLGPDGHVASLFPGFDQLDVDDTMVVPVTGSPKPPPERISLTFEALNRTEDVWFVVSGKGKADAVAKALATGDDAADVHDIPAVGVRGQKRTLWFLDDASASRLHTR